jgi:PKD repeat protein
MQTRWLVFAVFLSAIAMLPFVSASGLILINHEANSTSLYAPLNMVATSDHLYVGSSDQGAYGSLTTFRIDGANAVVPLQTSYFNNETYYIPNSMYINGNYLYFVRRYGSSSALVTHNISGANADVPLFMNLFMNSTVLTNVATMTGYGDYIYTVTATGQYLTTFDVSAGIPVQVNAQNTTGFTLYSGSPRLMYDNGNYLYILLGGTIGVYNVTGVNAAAPVYVTQVVTSAQDSTIYGADGYMYVGSSASNIMTFNISGVNEANPLLVSSKNFTNLNGIISMFKKDNYLYVGNMVQGIDMLDVSGSNIASPVEVNYFGAADGTVAFASQGNLIYSLSSQYTTGNIGAISTYDFISSGLLRDYRFDNSSSVMFDSVSSTTLGTSYAQWTSNGKFYGSLNLSSVTDYAEFAASQDIVDAMNDTNQFTTSVWIKSAIQGGGAVFTYNSGQAGLWIDETGEYSWFTGLTTGTIDWHNDTDIYSAGLWHNYVMVYDGLGSGRGNVSLYIDGVYSGVYPGVGSSSNNLSGGLIALNDLITFGGSTYGESLIGELDNFCIWNRALSITEVSVLASTNMNCDGSLLSPAAAFTQDTYGNTVTPVTVTFTDTSSGIPTYWFWNFGDGTNSTLQNPPPHTYTSSAGTIRYNPTLFVSNAYGNNTYSVTNAFVIVKEVSTEYIYDLRKLGATATLYLYNESNRTAIWSNVVGLTAVNFGDVVDYNSSAIVTTGLNVLRYPFDNSGIMWNVSYDMNHLAVDSVNNVVWGEQISTGNVLGLSLSNGSLMYSLTPTINYSSREIGVAVKNGVVYFPFNNASCAYGLVGYDTSGNVVDGPYACGAGMFSATAASSFAIYNQYLVLAINTSATARVYNMSSNSQLYTVSLLSTVPKTVKISSNGTYFIIGGRSSTTTARINSYYLSSGTAYTSSFPGVLSSDAQGARGVSIGEQGEIVASTGGNTTSKYISFWEPDPVSRVARWSVSVAGGTWGLSMFTIASEYVAPPIVPTLPVVSGQVCSGLVYPNEKNLPSQAEIYVNFSVSLYPDAANNSYVAYLQRASRLVSLMCSEVGNSTNKQFNCSAPMNYYYAPGMYDLHVNYTNYGLITNSTSSNLCQYGQLVAMQKTTSGLTFVGAGPGKEDINSSKVITLENTGNVDFTMFLTGKDLTGRTSPSVKLPASAFKVGKTLGSTVALLNNVAINTTIFIPAGSGSNDSVYLWLSMPANTLPQDYYSQDAWEIAGTS